MKSSASLPRTILAPILLGVLAVVLWQLAVVVLEIKPFVLPSPVSIATEFSSSVSSVWTSSLVTGANALIGLLIGAIIGIIAATVATVLPVTDELSAPLVAAASVIPIVALAPVLYTMFGADKETARQLVAALAVFIPVYLNTLRGLRQARPVHRDLMRAYGASSWQATRAVTLPGAVPFLFIGLRIASSLAVISALIGEYFGGPIGGLGKSITSAAASSNYSLAYAYVLGAIILGLAFYVVTLGLEKLVSPHRAPSTGP
jgi:NitT/TauT family transport system permease protein